MSEGSQSMGLTLPDMVNTGGVSMDLGDSPAGFGSKAHVLLIMQLKYSRHPFLQLQNGSQRNADTS